MKIVGGLVALILLGGGAYYLATKGAPATTTETGQQTSQAGNTNSIGGLVAAGKSVTCTFSTTTAANTTTGTLYVAGGMVAGDFTTVDPRAGTIESHMISRDNTAYVWTSLSNQGFKSTVTASSTTSGQSQQPVDYNAAMDYQCSDWIPDNAKFTVPTNITFMTAQSYTPPTSGTSVGAGAGTSMQGSAAQCAQCDQIPGAGAAQCRAALQCK